MGWFLDECRHVPARRGLNVEALFCGRQFPLGALDGRMKGLRYPAIFSQTGRSVPARRGRNFEALFCGRQFPLGALDGRMKGLRYPAIFSQTGRSEGLQDFDCAIEKFHGDLLLTIKSLRPRYTPEISFFISCQPQRGLICRCILEPGVNKSALPEQGERNDYLRPVYSQRASSFSQSMVPFGRNVFMASRHPPHRTRPTV